MLRIITYAGGGTTLTMPVTPESYKVTTEQSVDTINVHTAGDITITGTPRAAQWTETYLLPSKAYSFLSENSQAKPVSYTHLDVSKRQKLSNFRIKAFTVDREGNVGVTGISLPGAAELSVGGKKQLTANIQPSNATNKDVKLSLIHI